MKHLCVMSNKKNTCYTSTFTTDRVQAEFNIYIKALSFLYIKLNEKLLSQIIYYNDCVTNTFSNVTYILCLKKNMLAIIQFCTYYNAL